MNASRLGAPTSPVAVAVAERAHFVTPTVRVFHANHSIRTHRQRCAGHDAQALAAADAIGPGLARVHRADAAQVDWHVVAHDLEIGAAQKVSDVVLGAGEEVVHAQDVVAVLEESFAEVGAEEAGAAGDKNSHGGKMGRAVLK